ncbi:MAG: hypothetical protein LBS45_03960 [Synergistaceae bacterium]|jgi:hypothetical protein|nr:hypothetical protein [Synergistaceae bacterium]
MSSSDRAAAIFFVALAFSVVSFWLIASQKSREDKNIAYAGLGVGAAFAFLIAWIASL